MKTRRNFKKHNFFNDFQHSLALTREDMCRTDQISPTIKTFAHFWFTADFFAVGLFAFGGVALRIGIQNSLDGRIEVDPTQNFGPFIQMFYAKPYLLCNMVGCFVMAFCMTYHTQIATKSAPVYKGLTTGFCGCLTTFSSLMNESVNILWDRHWYKYIAMLLVEFLVTWAAFTLGFAAAKSFGDASAQETELTAQDDALQNVESGTASNQYEALELETGNREQPKTERGAIQTHVNMTLQTTQRYSQSVLQFWQQYEYYLLAILLITICSVIWLVLIFEPELSYSDNIKMRNTYRAVALAPLGAWTRWGLTKFPEIKNLWPEMHPQTMIANLSGVAIMCSLVVFSTSSWVYAIDAGFNGSLTTVSTFFAELHNLYIDKGPLFSLRYVATTVGLSIAIIEIIRGIKASL